MILPWMIYAIGVSAAFGAAAWLVERAFRELRWPSPRFVWLVAMVGSFILPWIPRQSQSISSAAGRPGSGLDFIGLVSGDPVLIGATYATLDRALAFVWLTLAVVLGIRTAMAVIAARRMARKWQPQRLAGNDVLLSQSTGPAVTGFLAGRIVVPEWLLGWERESQQLVVRHELEHVRARDPVLRLFATLVCVAVPWNLPLWWHRRRLELAIELDCDRRVLAHYPDRERYGGLLLEVAEAGFGNRSGLPAFSHPASALERRIRMVLTPHGPRAYTRSALTLMAATGVVMGAQSCAGPNAPDSGYLAALATAEVVAPQPPQVGGLILPGTPEDGQLELMLAEHHPDVVANGLPEWQSVWFIVDDDLNIVRTGIGEHDGLERRLRADYPDETTDYSLSFGVHLSEDIEVDVLLMVPEPRRDLLNLARLLAERHPDVFANGLPEGQNVWFILDDDFNVIRTGIGEHEGLEERLTADYPDEATEYILGLSVPVRGNIEVEVFLMVPEPQPGSVPPENGLGLLSVDDSLSTGLMAAVERARLLLNDIRENPDRYASGVWIF